MSGFRNAPSITEFAVGMRIIWSNGEHASTVVYIYDNGTALLSCAGRATNVDFYDLDLDSIWVNRQYSHREDKVIVQVESLSESDIYYHPLAYADKCIKAARAVFATSFIPLPAPEPPVQLGDKVRVEEEDGAAYGEVTTINHGASTFRIRAYTKWAELGFEFDKVIITKLVPERTAP